MDLAAVDVRPCIRRLPDYPDGDERTPARGLRIGTETNDVAVLPERVVADQSKNLGVADVHPEGLEGPRVPQGLVGGRRGRQAAVEELRAIDRVLSPSVGRREVLDRVRTDRVDRPAGAAPADDGEVRGGLRFCDLRKPGDPAEIEALFAE